MTTSTKVPSPDTSHLYYERYNGLAVPPVKESMEMFTAGAISVGVEFRVLNDNLMAALGVKDIAAANGYPILDDKGVSLHLFVHTSEGNHERLRFDCFDNDPHYHYFSVKGEWQDVLHLDRNVAGDPLHWAITMIHTRLQPMLLRADVENAGELIDPAKIDQMLPRVAEAAYRARFHSDKNVTEETAIEHGRGLWRTATDASRESRPDA